MDAEDNELGRLEKLLSNATFLSIDDAPALAARYGGFCYPAHIDRDSMSVLAALGEVPDHLGFHTVEVADPEKFFIGGRNASYPENITSSPAAMPTAQRHFYPMPPTPSTCRNAPSKP